ncbi:hypothetical protein [Kordiimonas sp.]|uniref:hypothetical protein n=1 Tax=Kordiimonas sp. TaxID=1970157 RepID=UPI003A8FCFE8
MLNELLQKIETAVRTRSYADVQTPLNKIFDQVEAGKVGLGGVSTSVTIISEKEATRIAGAVTAMLADTEYSLSNSCMLMLNRYKRALVQVFEISGYRGTDHIPALFGSRENGQKTYKQSDLIKLFSGLSINSMTDTLLTILMKLPPNMTLPVVFGMLSEQMIYTASGEKVRSKLLASSDHWKDAKAHQSTVFGIGPPYMGCSYAEAPHKHDFKYCFNNIVRNWLNSRNVGDQSLPSKRQIKKKPKLVIFAELYNAGHAMHRCYGPSIRALKEHFDTVLLMAGTEINAELRSLAHEVETVAFKHAQTAELVEKITSYKPDVIYYPSIGMRFSTICLSTLRLAPIQMMTIGHPATTRSDKMDYVILPDELMQNESTFSEKIMLRPTKPYFTHRNDAADIPADIRLDPDVVRIAIPAWSRKITPEFLNTCRRIRDLAKKPVEFWFFPNAGGALFQAISRRYSHIMPLDKVLPRKGYNQYIEDLNKCDIFLSSFPFGATNGIVDAALQGLPIVNMTGDEAHTANDASLVAHLAQPEWLTTHTVDEYIKAVVRLVDDPGLRVQISRNILSNNPEKAFFVDDDEDAWEFGEIANFIYHNHEEIQATDKKVWQFEEMVPATSSR